MSFIKRVEIVIRRYNFLKDELQKPFDNQKEFVELSKEFSEIGEFINDAFRFKKNLEEIDEIRKNLAEGLEEDHEMIDLMKEELASLEEEQIKLEESLKINFIPKDPNDAKNVILEVRAGTGGDEAGLFARDLFRMYERYSEIKRWKFEIMSISENDYGSFKEATASIQGKNVYGTLKFESGVHRVQRVPETEAAGRIHTSTATVAIMPEVEDFDFELDPKDLRIDVMRASGAGGQHVNTTDSAVRITHIPTGIVVTQQDERSQHMNKAKALKILRARIYDAEMQKRNDAIAKDRRMKIGTGERSERIRTYNFPQGRVTDHRINLTLYKIDQIMNGELDELTSTLKQEDLKDQLANYVAEDDALN